MTLSLSWITTLLFITIRLSTILLFTPIKAISQLPIHMRFILVFIFGLLLINYIPTNNNLNDKNILLGGIAEFSNGLILATSVYATFSIFQIAGQLIDNETGLNSLAIFNPGEHAQEPLTSHLLTALSVLLFFGMDGHLWLFKGLAYSFIIMPPGTISLFSGFKPVIKQFGFMFTTALMIASPIILSLLAIDLCGAVITRSMPQVNTYFLTLPIKILAGLFLLGAMLNYFNPICNNIFEQYFQLWQEIMS